MISRAALTQKSLKTIAEGQVIERRRREKNLYHNIYSNEVSLLIFRIYFFLSKKCIITTYRWISNTLMISYLAMQLVTRSIDQR